LTRSSFNIKCLGEGSKEGLDWLLLETDKGKVVYKQFWTGPGLAVEVEISADWNITESEADLIGLEASNWFNDNNPAIEEPIAGNNKFSW